MTINDAKPWASPWPAEGLEALDLCPICGSGLRTVLHASLVDCTFRTAPGEWVMWRCEDCVSGYLSPRPTPDRIHDAYLSYYTHTATQRSFAVGRRARLRARLANGYMRHQHGLQLEAASSWGVLAAALLPGKRRALDHLCRHLPKPKPGSRLLDVGCGSGDFLDTARQCGWQVVGLEPDPLAAAQASSRGLQVVVGGIEVFGDSREVFEAITLSHVVEHVHDPVDLLRACHRLLIPGGFLWLETPNVNSLGHHLFGPYWRGLEAPRHLTVFSKRALQSALHQAGFSNAIEQASPNPVNWIAGISWAMARGLPADTPAPLPWRLWLRVRLLSWLRRASADVSQAEFITCVAHKTLR